MSRNTFVPLPKMMPERNYNYPSSSGYHLHPANSSYGTRPNKQEYTFYPSRNHFQNVPPSPVSTTVPRGTNRMNNAPNNNTGRQQNQHNNRPKRGKYRNGNRYSNNEARPEQVSPNKDTMSLYTCPKCEESYSYKEGYNKQIGKIPLILHCNHTLCLECIYSHTKNDKFKCPICHIDSTIVLEEGSNFTQIELQNIFTPNYYILGVIMYKKNPTYLNELDNVKLVQNASKQHSSAVQEPFERCSFDQCSKKGTMNCPDCEAIYCRDCCNIIHKSINKLTSHKPVPYQNAKFNLQLKYCESHPQMQSEYFCKDCDMYACCYCVLEEHATHHRDNLCQLTKSEMDEFKQLQKQAHTVLKEVIAAQKKASKLTNCNSNSIKKDISRVFCDFHAKLSVIEKKLYSEADNIQFSSGNLEAIQHSLASSADTLKQLLRFDETASTEKINFRTALTKLRSALDIPRYLSAKDGDVGHVRFSFDAALFDSLDRMFALKQNGSQYELLTEGDPGVDLDDLDLSDVSEGDSASVAKTDFSQNQSETSKNQHYVGMDKISLQHINSMDSFYVQYKKDLAKLTNLNKQIENYVKIGGAQTVDKPDLNELYLALYITDSQKESAREQCWCRARLVDIKKKGTYDMFFIDYGKTQTLSVDRIRDIPNFLACKKPFAIECSLHNPMNLTWSKNSHFTLAKILNGKDLFMIVKSVEHSIYVVDLMISSSDGGLASVIDILVHGTHSVAVSSNADVNSDHSFSSITENTLRNRVTVYPNSYKFKKDEAFEVVIANVIDPYNVIVHEVKNAEMFKSLCRDIKNAFKQTKDRECVPVEGIYVMVHYKGDFDKNFNHHRALIKSVDLDNDKVEAYLVDWGTSVIVSSSKVRPLPEYLTKMECQAVLVKLADVSPYNKKPTWHPSAGHFLESYHRHQTVLKMIVSSEPPQLQVALFDTSGNVDLCLNTMMVENNLADSTGEISTQLEWLHGMNEDVQTPDNGDFLSTLLKNVSESSDEDSGNEDTSMMRRQVDIIKVNSPDDIWLKFITFRDRDSKLFEELQIHYSNTTNRPTKSSWNVEELCVAELPGEYARGKIIEIMDQKCLINLYDKAEEVVLPLDRIYVFDKYFSVYPEVAVKTHLDYIKPAGDTGNWSISSIETIKQILSKRKKVFLSIIKNSQNTSNHSLPIELWYSVLKGGGALVPNKTKYVSISNILAKLGFAYRTTKPQTKPNIVNNGEDLLKSLTIDDKQSSETDVIEEATTEISETVEGDKEEEEDAEISWIDLVEKELNEAENKPFEQYVSLIQKTEKSVEDWLPTPRLQNTKFEARVTCAETCGHLYIREEFMDECYLKMEKEMTDYFNQHPPTRNSHVWKSGDLCTIKYEDGKWYRGRVFKVIDNNEVTVIMIDFGSDHDVDVNDIFREILYSEIGCFANKVKLNNVYCKGNWLSSDYDHFKELLTDWCTIEVQKPLQVDMPLVDVYNSKGVHVNEALVQMCPNLSRTGIFAVQQPPDDEDEAIVIEEIESFDIEESQGNNDNDAVGDDQEEVSNKKLSYISQTIPEELHDDGMMKMVIGGLLNYHKVALKRPGQDLSPEIYDLMIDIQDVVDTYPSLKDSEIGTPCMAEYTEDKVWYRARICANDKLDSGLVKVFYVDYGNSEMVRFDTLKETTPKLLEIPQQVWEAELNIQIVDENELVDILKLVNSLTTTYIKIVKLDPFVVDLCDEDGNLVYQEFLDRKVLDIKF